MKKPGFPLSTLALVAIMVGALFMVSKQVTTAPAMPPVEPVTPVSATEPRKEPTPAEKEKESEKQKAMAKFYQEKMKHDAEAKKREAAAQKKVMETAAKMGKASGQAIHKYDPNSTEINAKYFSDMPMGEDGIEATDKAVALASAAKEKLQREAAARGEKPGMQDSRPAPPGAKH